MFSLSDSFRSYDKKGQPYSFSLEQHTQIQNYHARVIPEGFALRSVGNRHILNAPAMQDFFFSMDFHITYMEEFDPVFTVLFHYDQEHRKGHGLRIRYRLTGDLTLELVYLERSLVTVLEAREFPGVLWQEAKTQTLVLECEEDTLCCQLSGIELVLPCSQGRGKLALERESFMGELVVERIHFESREPLDIQPLLPPVCIPVPLINGGDIPYTVTWQVDKIGSELYMTASLDGGTKTRAVNREDRPGQYVAEKDTMTSPYAGIRLGDRHQIFQLSLGQNRMIDPNIYWECQKGFFGDTPLPIRGRFLLDLPWEGEPELIFGYEKLSCGGYPAQQGGHEFRFRQDGTLLRSAAGPWEIYSPFDKYAVSMIPQDCWHREEIIHHLKYNHYFERAEDIHFTLELQTGLDPDYLELDAQILNVFESQILQAAVPRVTVTEEGLRAEADFPAMEVGVYKIRYRLYYGGVLRDTMQRVFEVFNKDTDENPALKTGLPFTFSMPNEQKWLMRGSFDLWSPQISCDVEHYITCITDTPIEAELRRPWELVKLFKREWFAWLGKRTCKDHESDRHAIIRQKADYLFFGMDDGTTDWLDSGSIFPFRADHWNMSRLNNPYQRDLLNRFLDAQPGAAESIGYEKDAPMRPETFEQFMKRYGKAWIRYANESFLELFRQQNATLRKENPGVRRAMYGPFNSYVTPALSHHCLPLFGIPEGDAVWQDIYTGFAIFEDYPYSCGYQPYRGAFGVMALTLHHPQLKLYPEQYTGGIGGCIDGAVKYAHAPMGAYSIRYDQNSTHAFEFAFNTACKDREGWRYWTHYGFHRSGLHGEYIDRLVKDWRFVLENKPARPLRSIAFLMEFDREEDRFRVNRYEKRNFYAFTNPSESAMGLLYECGREAGIPNGFAVNWEALETLTAADCDVLVLPSMKNAPRDAVDKVRQLFAEGVNLVALSDVTGLEDLFGVKPQMVEETVYTVTYEETSDSVYPMNACFRYAPAGATVIMNANGEVPAMLATGRTLLLNTDPECLGSEDPRKVNVSQGYHLVGALLRSAMCRELVRLSKPLAKGENVGVTLFQTQEGKLVLLAIDYSSYDDAEPEEKEAIVALSLPGVIAVESCREILTGKKAGQIRELRFPIRPHEAVFIELLTQ